MVERLRTIRRTIRDSGQYIIIYLCKMFARYTDRSAEESSIHGLVLGLAASIAAYAASLGTYVPQLDILAAKSISPT